MNLLALTQIADAKGAPGSQKKRKRTDNREGMHRKKIRGPQGKSSPKAQKPHRKVGGGLDLDVYNGRLLVMQLIASVNVSGNGR